MDRLAASLADDLDLAFSALVTEMGPRLYWGLRRISGDHHHAEDLTQETLVRAYRAMRAMSGGDRAALALSPWLWTIALNLGRNHLRDRGRRPQPAALTELAGSDPEPVDDVAWDRRMSTLSRAQRTAVVLRHVVGMGIAEISAATGRPQGTVKADIHRGLARLRQVMEAEQ